MPIRLNQDGSLTNGVYDDQKTHSREKYVDGKLTHTLSHLWIHAEDKESRDRLTEDWMLPPFGSFPDLPLKKK